MPILHGERLIGRVDPKMNRKTGRFIINALHLEPGVHPDADTRRAVEKALGSLAAFLGAEGIALPSIGQ
jgi:uncharacterized protein YcaQ